MKVPAYDITFYELKDMKANQSCRIIPNMDSYISLMTINLMEYIEDWSAGRCYINQEVISLTREDREKAA